METCTIAYVKIKKKWRFTIHYVKPTAQLLFKSRFPKSGQTYRRQVIRYQQYHQRSIGIWTSCGIYGPHFVQILQNFIPRGQIDNKSSLVQVRNSTKKVIYITWTNVDQAVWHHVVSLTLDQFNTMAGTISHMTFSNAFSWMKYFVFWLKFHWSLFLRVQLTITQHWFR